MGFLEVRSGASALFSIEHTETESVREGRVEESKSKFPGNYDNIFQKEKYLNV